MSLSTILLIACSNQSSNSLDGEYYWINESRNEVAFTISGNKGNINKGEADAFTIDKDSSIIEHKPKRELYLQEWRIHCRYFRNEAGLLQKDSEAYKEAIKKYGNK